METLKRRIIGRIPTDAFVFRFAAHDTDQQAFPPDIVHANTSQCVGVSALLRLAWGVVAKFTIIESSKIGCNGSTGIRDRKGRKLVCGSLVFAFCILTAGIGHAAGVQNAPPQPCHPSSSHEVAVRSATNQCAKKGAGIYSTTSAIGLGDQGIDSIERGSDVKASVCGIHRVYGLQCGEVTNGLTQLRKDPDIRWTFLRVVLGECLPKSNEVSLWPEDIRYIGPCVRLRLGTYKTAEEFGVNNDTFWSHKIEELRKKGTLLLKEEGGYVVRVGDGVEAQICEKDNFAGRCKKILENSEYRVRWPDVSAGSLRAWSRCRLRDDEVVLFGVSDSVGPCTIRKVGAYPSPFERSLEVEGGSIRSIEVGQLVEARACSESNMKGDCVDIKGAWNNDRYLGAANFTGPIRSLIVRARPLAKLTFTSDVAAPQHINSTITFTAAVVGGMEPYEYSFLIYEGGQFTSVQDWSTRNTYTWNPTSANPHYMVRVAARCKECYWGRMSIGIEEVSYPISP